jgi:hypothetical protein
VSYRETISLTTMLPDGRWIEASEAVVEGQERAAGNLAFKAHIRARLQLYESVFRPTCGDYFLKGPRLLWPLIGGSYEMP